MFAARLALGVGEAPTFPANAKAIGLWFPGKERSFATSIFDAAAKFASAIGVPFIGIVLIGLGWRWSFALTGLVSFAYFVIFWRVYRDPDDDPRLGRLEREYIEEEVIGSGAGDRLPAKPASLGYLLSQRKVIGLAIGFGSYNSSFTCCSPGCRAICLLRSTSTFSIRFFTPASHGSLHLRLTFWWGDCWWIG